MLRNTGINVTERKIREDTQKAYEYDCFHEYPRRGWRRDAGYFDSDVYNAGFKAHIRRQPRYNYTIPRHIPTYARSSISSCIRHSELDRVKMIYLPEKDWSAESPYLIREPRYREKSYSNHIKSYHISEVERPFRRNLKYNAESPPWRTSSVCFEENKMERIIDATKYIIDNYSPRRDSSKYRNPARKVTKKLSPIRILDCNTSCMVQQPKYNKYSTNFDNPIRTDTKPKSNNLSKEPRKISLDIHKILSLLQKTDVEEEEQYSLESLLQKTHSLECSSTNNVNHRKTELITERVQIFPNMEKKVQDPKTKFKNVSGVRSKLEALVNLLKHYENENTLTDCPAVGSSKKDIVPKYENPPTQEVRSFLNEKGVKSSNDETKEHIGQKDIVLQTEEPKTSNKSICGEINKNNSIEERKLLKSRFSWKSKEKTEFKKCKEREKEKRSVKEFERNKLSYFKKSSKDKTHSDKTMASKQHLTNNGHEAKTGLMITIGGKVLRKKLANSEKRHEKMSHTWLKKYLDSKKDHKDNDIHHRWNNRAYYTKSSSTVMELINNVYNQMGMDLKSKTDDMSRNPYILKSSRRNGHKSPRKTRYRQRLEAYMVPQMVTHGPMFDKILSADINHVTKNIEKLMSNTKLPFEKNIYLQNKYSMNPKVLTMTNDPSSIFFRIYMAKDYFDTVSISNQELRDSTSDERVCKITEYEATQSHIFNNPFTENLCQEMRSIAHDKKHDDMHRDAIVQVSYANSGFLKKCGVGTTIVSEQGPENETTKLESQMQEFVDEETSSKTIRALAEQALQDGRSLPVSFDSKLSAHGRLSKIKDGHQSVEKNKATNIYNQDVRNTQYSPNSQNVQSSKLSSPTQDQDMLCSKEYEDITLSLTVPGKNTKTKTKNRAVSKYSTEVNKRKKFYTSRKSKWTSRIKPIAIIRWNNYIETSRKSPGKQFKIDKCTYYCSETENKSKAEDQSPFQVKSTQYPYKIQYPYVQQIPYQQTFPIPQHLQLPQYLPQPICAPQLLCQTQYPELHEPQYIKIPQQLYGPRPLPHSKYPLGPLFISDLQYAPQTTYDLQNAPTTQDPLKYETRFEPPYAHQTLYAHIAESIFELNDPPQVEYLPGVEFKPGLQLSTGASFLLKSQLEVGTPQVQYPPGVQWVPEAQGREIYRPPMQYPSKAKLQPEIFKANEKLESKNLSMKPSALLLSARVDNLKAKKEVELETKITPKKTSDVLLIVKPKLNASEQSQSKISFESKELAGLSQAQTKYPPVIFKGDQPENKLKLDKSQQVIRLSFADSPGFKLQPTHYSPGHQVPYLQLTGPQYYEYNSLTQSQSYTQYSRPTEPRESYQSRISVCFINTKHKTSKQKLMHKKSSKSKILTQLSQGTKLRSTKINKVNHKEQGITETHRRCKDGIGLRLKIFPFNNITFIESRSKKRVSKELNHHKHCHKCKRGSEKRTSGGIVININMNGDDDPHRMNNLKSTYQQTSQESTVKNKVVEKIVQPTTRIPNDSIKIDFGINIVNSRVFKISKNLTDHFISDGLAENVFKEINRAAERLSGSVLYVSSNQNYSNSFHQISRQCYSRATSPLNEETRDNSIESGCIVESTIKRTNSRLKNNVSKIVKNSSMENFNVIENYVNHLFGPIGEIKPNNLRWVEETKSMLEAIKTMNASGDMTLTNIKINSNLSDLLIKPKKLKCREIVNKRSKKRQNHKKNKLLKDQTDMTNKEKPVVKSKTSRFSSLCNSLARNLNMFTVYKHQHEKVDVKTSCYIRTDRDVTCGVSSFGIQDIQRHSPVTSTIPAASLENNKNVVDDCKTLGKHDTIQIGPACEIACKPSKRDKLLTKVKQTFSHYVKNMKKNAGKKNEKNKAQLNKNDTIILASVTPYKSQENSYLLEHKEIPVMINNNSVKMNINPMGGVFNKSDEADILQSYTVKKAVLQIYTDESVTQTDYLVAKIPKYSFL